MGLTGKLVQLTIRAVWFAVVGWWLGLLYLLPAVIMAPFRTMYGGRVLKKWWQITTLAPSKKSDWA